MQSEAVICHFHFDNNINIEVFSLAERMLEIIFYGKMNVQDFNWQDIIIEVSQVVCKKDTASGLTSAPRALCCQGSCWPCIPPFHKALATSLSHKADWSFSLHPFIDL